MVIIEADNDRNELLDGWIVVEYINHSENADIASCIVILFEIFFCEVCIPRNTSILHKFASIVSS